jgi:hypothetical protein
MSINSTRLRYEECVCICNYYHIYIYIYIYPAFKGQIAMMVCVCVCVCVCIYIIFKQEVIHMYHVYRGHMSKHSSRHSLEAFIDMIHTRIYGIYMCVHTPILSLRPSYINIYIYTHRQTQVVSMKVIGWLGWMWMHDFHIYIYTHTHRQTHIVTMKVTCWPGGMLVHIYLLLHIYILPPKDTC